jgi:hypothetical protein
MFISCSGGGKGSGSAVRAAGEGVYTVACVICWVLNGREISGRLDFEAAGMISFETKSRHIRCWK